MWEDEVRMILERAGRYPLVNVYMAIENHHFKMQIIYKWNIFHSFLYVYWKSIGNPLDGESRKWGWDPNHQEKPTEVIVAIVAPYKNG